MSNATSVVKKMVMPRIKKYSASTLGAIVDADSGNIGKY
jgi:hypothetical protein